MANIASTTLVSGCSLKLSDQLSFKCNSTNLFVKSIRSKKPAITANRRRFTCQAILCGDSGRPSSTSLFVGGFLLGGIVVGTLGCVYAPQIRALDEANSKDIIRKLPKFIYNEDKVLEKTRKKLADKIEQLNAAIDGVSSQLQSDDVPYRASIESNEIEAAL